jgi:hypothetical protein
MHHPSLFTVVVAEKAGSDNKELTEFVTAFQSSMVKEVKDACFESGSPCDSATAIVTAMEPTSKRRKMLATSVSMICAYNPALLHSDVCLTGCIIRYRILMTR